MIKEKSLELYRIEQQIWNCNCIAEIQKLLESIKNKEFSTFELLWIQEGIELKLEHLTNQYKFN